MSNNSLNVDTNFKSRRTGSTSSRSNNNQKKIILKNLKKNDEATSQSPKFRQISINNNKKQIKSSRSGKDLNPFKDQDLGIKKLLSKYGKTAEQYLNIMERPQTPNLQTKQKFDTASNGNTDNNQRDAFCMTSRENGDAVNISNSLINLSKQELKPKRRGDSIETYQNINNSAIHGDLYKHSVLTQPIENTNQQVWNESQT